MLILFEETVFHSASKEEQFIFLFPPFIIIKEETHIVEEAFIGATFCYVELYQVIT